MIVGMLVVCRSHEDHEEQSEEEGKRANIVRESMEVLRMNDRGGYTVPAEGLYPFQVADMSPLSPFLLYIGSHISLPPNLIFFALTPSSVVFGIFACKKLTSLKVLTFLTLFCCQSSFLCTNPSSYMCLAFCLQS